MSTEHEESPDEIERIAREFKQELDLVGDDFLRDISNDSFNR